jgi:hypothetical protein
MNELTRIHPSQRLLVVNHVRRIIGGLNLREALHADGMDLSDAVLVLPGRSPWRTRHGGLRLRLISFSISSWRKRKEWRKALFKGMNSRNPGKVRMRPEFSVLGARSIRERPRDRPVWQGTT